MGKTKSYPWESVERSVTGKSTYQCHPNLALPSGRRCRLPCGSRLNGSDRSDANFSWSRASDRVGPLCDVPRARRCNRLRGSRHGPDHSGGTPMTRRMPALVTVLLTAFALAAISLWPARAADPADKGGLARGDKCTVFLR